MSRILYPKILAYYIGRCLGVPYKGIAVVKLKDGTVHWDTVNLEPK